jgi:iron complex outermembrane receptor protein
MRNWIFYFVIFTVLALPIFSNAQEGKKGEESLTTLEEVVVTATKTEEERKNVPNSIILMDEMDIQESSANSLGELLANELGVDWRTKGNYGGAVEEIHIRGMSGNATQVFVNGVSINSPSVGVADVSRIPLNNIERIEVVKGSGSLLYGSGAMGGTVNIITKRPKKEKIDLRADAGYGSYDTYQLSAEQGMFAWGDFGYYLTANRRETDGFRDNSDLDHKAVSLKLVLDKGDALDISLYGDYIDREYGRPGVKPPKGTQDFFIGGIKVYNDEAASLLDSGSDEDYHLVIEAKSEPVQWLGLRVRGDYTDMENYNYGRYVDFFGLLLGAKTWTTNEVYGIEGNVDIKPFDGTSLLLGTEYKAYDWKNKGVDLDANGVEDPATRLTTKADLHTTGTFAEAQYRPCKYFKALAGIRHEDHSEFGTEYVPLYGVIFNPLENTALKLSHGRHFLAPTPNDLFWPEDPWAKGNADLRPEKGWHTDVTVEQSLFCDKLFTTLSYFHWDVDNKIQWGPDSNGVFTPENLRTYEADGLEVGTEIGPFYNMALGLSYTYLDAEEESKAYTKQDFGWPPFLPPDFQYTWVKRRATYAPDHLFKGNLTYWSEFGLTATATVRYVSDRVWYRTETDVAYPATKTVKYTLDSYWTVDLKVQQRLYNHWLVSLQGNNLFDKDYDTYFDAFTDIALDQTTVEGFPGAGRSVFFSLTYEY